jgi:hypothetical protein
MTIVIENIVVKGVCRVALVKIEQKEIENAKKTKITEVTLIVREAPNPLLVGATERISLFTGNEMGKRQLKEFIEALLAMEMPEGISEVEEDDLIGEEATVLITREEYQGKVYPRIANAWPASEYDQRADMLASIPVQNTAGTPF